MTTLQIMAAYEAGKRAASAGLGRDANPYPFGHIGRFWWNDGYMAVVRGNQALTTIVGTRRNLE